MKSVVLAVALVLSAALPAFSQANFPGQASVLFSLSQTHTTAADVAQTNAAAIVDSSGLILVSPGVASAAAIADFPTWAAYLGDTDGDGDFAEAIVGSLDALFVLDLGIVSPPGFFDMAMSVSEDFGPDGLPNGMIIRDGDVFQPTPAGINVFLSEALIQSSLGTVDDLDVDAFTLDRSTGDIFLSFDATITTIAGVLQDGGVARIPAGAYTRVGNNVVSVVPGGGGIFYSEATVSSFFINAGLSGVTNVSGLEIEPNTSRIWMANDDPIQGPVVVSTAGAGTIVSINGVPLQSPGAFGMQPLDFAGTSLNSLTALAIDTTPPTGTPMMFDATPSTLSGTGVITLSVAGAVPGSTMFLFGDVYAAASGSFPARFFGILPPAAGNWPEIYGLPPSPLGQILLTIPPTAGPNASGLASWTLPITTAVPVPISFVLQAIALPGPGSILFSSPLVYTIAP